MERTRGFVETYVLGIADDTPSVNRLLVVSRVTHWLCFLIAVGCALKFSQQYLGNGHLWAAPPEEVSDRTLLQLMFHQMMWLFGTGIALVAAFISWVNTDVLVNRQMLLKSAAPPTAVVSSRPADVSAETAAAG